MGASSGACRQCCGTYPSARLEWARWSSLSLRGVLRAISWVFALVSRTQSAVADGTRTRTRWPRVPAVRFEYEYHFIEYKYEKNSS